MTARSAIHATFVVERVYPAAPGRVFAAWAQPEAKAAWFACHDDWQATLHEMDFRVGGRERLRTAPPGEEVHAFDAVYSDIVQGERIVYAYEMRLGERLISISLTTVEFKPSGEDTRLVFTEQGVFLDGYDDIAGREEGTRIGLENLARRLTDLPAPVT